MTELKQTAKTQIAALHAQGKTVEEITKVSGVSQSEVEEFLRSRGKTPNTSTRQYTKMSDEQKSEILRLHGNGVSIGQISIDLGINKSTVQKFLQKHKEKEPAPAATGTSSMDVKRGVSTSKDNTDKAECQELNGLDVLPILENTLNEWLGSKGMGSQANTATVTEIIANKAVARVKFNFNGNAYELFFGEADE